MPRAAETELPKESSAIDVAIFIVKVYREEENDERLKDRHLAIKSCEDSAEV
jgi:hypothetical protein